VLAYKPLKQGRRLTWQFLIKWKGYGPEHNSWEPMSNIATPELTLGPYWKSIGGEPENPKATPKGKTAAPKRKAQAVVRPKARRKL